MMRGDGTHPMVRAHRGSVPHPTASVLPGRRLRRALAAGVLITLVCTALAVRAALVDGAWINGWTWWAILAAAITAVLTALDERPLR